MACPTRLYPLFSSSNFLNQLLVDSYEHIKSTLNWYMWESTASVVTAFGTPSDEDVLKFKDLIAQRSDLSDKQRHCLLKICDDYIFSNDD